MTPFPPGFPQKPNNGDDDGGFYNPQFPNYKVLPNYQQWVNSTKGKLSIQTEYAIHNLIKQLPNLRAEAIKLAGEGVMWLRKLTSGKRCPRFDENDNCDTYSKCNICYGTGWVGGYEKAVYLPMSFIPGRADVLIAEAGLTVSQKPQAWTLITHPIMQAMDIVVSFSNERYLINGSEAIEHQGVRHYQELTLERIDKADVRYYVPVPGIVGDAFHDFKAHIIIAPLKVATTTGRKQSMPGFNFDATISIRNYMTSLDDGITPYLQD